MKNYDQLIKKINEVNYLTAINADRYRIIIRYFYEEYEKIHYWLNREDLVLMMRETGLFPDYTAAQCQLDLQALCDWGNLTATQDTAKALTIEEFKNKKYRYQLNEYTVEIERMTLKLENMEIEGSSLQPTLVERIRRQIQDLHLLLDKSDEEAAEAWNSLNADFIRLNRNYQDYIKTLNSAHAEEMMQTEQFLIFKDQLLIYLRTFIRTLQEHTIVLEEILNQISQEQMQQLFNKIVNYEQSVPRIDRKVNPEEILKNCWGRWHSLINWFVGEAGESEIHHIYESTNEIIRRMTRYAQQISERYIQGVSRVEDYRHLAGIFQQCHTVEEAHCLSAMIFGPDAVLHLRGLPPRETDSIDSGVFQEVPTYFDLDSRSRSGRQKTKRIPQPDYRIERQLLKIEIEHQQQQRREKIRALIYQRKIDFAALPVISQELRKILLGWLSRGLSSSTRRARTEDGVYFHLLEQDTARQCCVHCEDGDFWMPHYILEMEDDY